MSLKKSIKKQKLKKTSGKEPHHVISQNSTADVLTKVSKLKATLIQNDGNFPKGIISLSSFLNMKKEPLKLSDMKVLHTKQIKYVSQQWTDVMAHGICKILKAMDGEEEDIENDEINNHDNNIVSLDDDGVDPSLAISKRLMRQAIASDLCGILKSQVSASLNSKDIDILFPSPCINFYVHPYVAIKTQNSNNMSLMALKDIPLGTQVIIEDSFNDATLHYDELCLCDKLQITIDEFDQLEGLVDVAAMIHTFTRTLLRLNPELIDLYDDEDKKFFEEKKAAISKFEKATLTASFLSSLYPRTNEDYNKIKATEGLEGIKNKKLINIITQDLNLLSELSGITNHNMIFQKFKLNGFSIHQFEEQFTSSALEAAGGSALFLYSSFINHSCAPTLSRSYLGNTTIISTIRNVTAGEELTISYIPIEELALDKQNRYDSLKDKDFTCHCERCSSEGKKNYDNKLKNCVTEIKTVEEKLIKCYEDNQYKKAMKIAFKAFNIYSTALSDIIYNHNNNNSKHPILEINILYSDKLKLFLKETYGIKLKWKPLKAIDETILFSLGHIMRCLLLLSSTTSSSELLEEVIDVTFEHCCKISSFLYGGDSTTFILRWKKEMAGSFFAPLTDPKMEIAMTDRLMKLQTKYKVKYT